MSRDAGGRVATRASMCWTGLGEGSTPSEEECTTADFWHVPTSAHHSTLCDLARYASSELCVLAHESS